MSEKYIKGRELPRAKMRHREGKVRQRSVRTAETFPVFDTRFLPRVEGAQGQRGSGIFHCLSLP